MPASARLFRDLNHLPESIRHGAVAIGKFDGVHRGHARLVERLLAMAERVAGPAVVFTFDPLPAKILYPTKPHTPLSWIERKADLLTHLGVDAVVAYPIDEAFLQMPAQAFFDGVLRGRLDARAIVEGPNFFFGHNREGTVGRLREFCDASGVLLEVVERVELQGKTVSSSQIRRLIAAGQLEAAQAMLGHPYRIHGRVIHGAQRGRGLGFPTANLDQSDTLLPADGIYAGRAWVEGTAWPAGVSIGPNPTFGEATRKVEVYLSGYQGDLYNQMLEVDFFARLRDIRQFESAEALVVQMEQDIRDVVRLNESHGSSSQGVAVEKPGRRIP